MRLVDATGEAMAWIAVGAGGQCVSFQVRDGAGAWHAADPGVTGCVADDVACHLISRDPTGCVLACAGREVQLWLEDGALHREG